MKFVKADSSHNISAIQKSGSVGNYHLNWDSVGLELFIVAVGENSKDVSINVDNIAGNKLCSLLNEADMDLINRESIVSLSHGLTIYAVTFAQLKQKGGFNVNGHPGVYAVYGCAVNNDSITVYVSEDAVFRLSVEVNIDDAPVIKQKGLIRKVNYYAGYRKVTIQKGVRGLKGNSVYYTIDNEPYKYPLPDEIISNGGSFYVKCSETSNIKFDTNNKDGIRIRR